MAAGSSKRADALMLDPRARRLLDRLAALKTAHGTLPTIPERRESMRLLLQLGAVQLPDIEASSTSIPGPGGPLPVRIYSPAQTASRILPGLIYFHGGGFVSGSLDTHDGICRALTRSSGCRVVAVDYRLAPEHPYPAAMDDAHAATLWIAARPAEYALDPKRIGVCGDSAGATLATQVCRRIAADGTASLALQLLLCPITDYAGDSPSRQEFANGYLLDRWTLDQDCQCYVPHDMDAADARISPLRASGLEGLPPTSIHTAECDPVRDEGELYAQRLRQAGIDTTYCCHSGMIHLFYGLGRLIPHAAIAWQQIGHEVRARLHP
jgi:acetyl esterase